MRFFTLLFILLLAPLAASAQSFKPGRGLALDIWQTWPEEARWNEPDVMLPFPEWQKTLSDADLAALKASGLTMLRLPVDPSPFLSGKSRALHGDLLTSVLKAVARVNAAGLKAVVDMHGVPSSGNRAIGTAEILEDEAMFGRYAAHVGRVAAAISNLDPSSVSLELLNEPVTGCEGEEQASWQEQLGALHKTARAAAPNLTLILSGACWGSAEGLSAMDPSQFDDPNILWSFHSYDPFLLTHQGATWAGDFILHVTGLPFPLHGVPREELDAAVENIRETIRANAPFARRAGLLAYLDEQVATMDTEAEMDAVMGAPFARVAAWAEKHAIPASRILMGEFGMIRQEYGNPYVVPSATRAAYYKAMIGRAEAHGYAWSMWDHGGAFGVIDEFDGRRAEPDVMDMIRTLPPR